MADLTDILQLETQIDESIKKVFINLDIKPVTRVDLTFQQETPRVEIKTKVGSVTGKKGIRLSDNTVQYCAWRVDVAVQTVVTKINDGVNSLPMQFLASVRKVMTTIARQSWDDFDNFPNVIFAEPLKDGGTQINTKQDDGFEYSVCGFSGIIMIRDMSVW